MKVGDIATAAYNPRKDLAPTDPEYVRIKSSVETFGLVEPLVWNKRSGNLVGGHQRLKVMRDLGVAVVDVSVVDLNDVQEKALNVALNKVGGAWDMVALASVLGELQGLPEFALTGFTAQEFKTIAGSKEGLTDPDAIPEAKARTAVRRGHLYALGQHRVLCGDSTVSGDVARLLAGATPALMVTDPPYGVKYDPTWRAAAGVNKNPAKQGKVTNDDRADWTPAWNLSPSTIAYVWHGGLHAGTVAASLAAADFVMRGQIVWAKDRIVLSRGAYHWQHEPCWYAVKSGATAGWIGDRKQSTVWQIPSRDDSGHGHGTQKPVECMERPMRNHAGDVYDPFLGSGTTLIAAERQERACYGMEIDPTYVQIIIDRWEAFTGLKATRVK